MLLNSWVFFRFFRSLWSDVCGPHTLPRFAHSPFTFLPPSPFLQFLDRIKRAYDRNPALANLLVDPEFADEVNSRQAAWRRVVALCVASGIACPSFSASLGYFDQYRRERLPANLTQAQRDFFGAHTYERVDKAGAFHTEWAKND